MTRMLPVLATAAGSAFGALARYGIGLFTEAGSFPLGTLLANGIGAFLIGLGASLLGPQGPGRNIPLLGFLLLTGFCGGFTTFSMFSLETLLLFAAGDVATAGLNVGLSLIVWLLAVGIGHVLGQRLIVGPF
ncbi:hypothetical protein EMQ25_10670 [Arsenicitalea aurantiaca]|uniref:Fluoride-specific ion channel FluC n=1 Tax=Arsenicitalea aurantiaca TaxID=1783274 RepID=A0A433XB55_9HYPH|nr:CrcB family protein [Arsenicitalea aurantiaca]RUT31309.1 hypothetical protein EMQ25_10670 [Arsenicitalea aurantiaca]